MKIKTIIAAEMLDSRGNPTVEAQVILSELPQNAPLSLCRW